VPEVEEPGLGVESGRAAPGRRPRRRQRRGQPLGRDDGERRGPRAPDGFDVVRPALDHDRQRRLGVLELVEHLVVAVVGIDRHDAGAQRVQRQVVEEELGTVLEEEPDPVPVAVPRRRVALAERQHRVARPGVRDLDAVGMPGAPGRGRRAEERVVGRLARRGHERVEDGTRHGTGL
jgi:hypothetical protein